MRTPLLAAVTTIAALTLLGCSQSADLPLKPTTAEDLQLVVRHIEIDVADLETGLPCTVVDRPEAGSHDILWRAEFEADFCRRKAEETRRVLQDKGWACRPLTATETERLARTPGRRSSGDSSHLVAAWSCIEGLRPIQSPIAVRPPVPRAKPDLPVDRSTPWGNERLRQAVEVDLAAIGQGFDDEATSVDAALGDLNDDGADDAVVVLTRGTGAERSYHMLMAYVQSSEAYHLVDVWILDAPKYRAHDRLIPTIEEGEVRLNPCCEDEQDPTIFLLVDRKLTHAQKS